MRSAVQSFALVLGVVSFAGSGPALCQEPVFLKGHADIVRALAFSPDGKLLASGSDDGTVKLWTASSMTLLKTVPGNCSSVRALAFHPSGEFLLWGGPIGGVHILNVKGGKETVTPKVLPGEKRRTQQRIVLGALTVTLPNRLTLNEDQQPGIHALAISPDGKTLATANNDGILQIWDFHARKLRHSIDMMANSIAFSPDGKRLAAGTGFTGQVNGERAVVLWDVATGKESQRFKPNDNPSEGPFNDNACVAFSPDGRHLASGGSLHAGGTLWNLKTGNYHWGFRGGSSSAASVDNLLFTPDGKFLVATESTYINIWNAPEPNICPRKVLKANEDCFFWAAAISPDGRWLAVGTGKGLVQDGKVLPPETRIGKEIALWKIEELVKEK